MRMLVTWGSKMGGTEGIARVIADALVAQGVQVVAKPAKAVRTIEPDAYDAVVVGGALYANAWHKDARRFVDRNAHALRAMPVWFFSSGPLDDSADKGAIAPVPQAAVRMERIGAVGHETFGGRLDASAKGFPATAMAKEHAGDWRNNERIRAWARDVAVALPRAKPRPFAEPAGRSLARLFAHGALGWAACAVTMAALLLFTPTRVALTLHAIAAPLFFLGIAVHYFRKRGAREPLFTAAAFTAVVALLDAVVVAGAVLRDFTMFTSVAGTWLPFALIFITTWATGALMATMPWPKLPTKAAAAAAASAAAATATGGRDADARNHEPARAH